MASSVRIKICGLRSPEQALAAVAAGADAIGLNFHGASPRVVEVAVAREICAVLPPFVTSVGLFVDAPAAVVERVLAAVPLQMLQFHGDEDEAYCGQWHRPYLKVLRMREGLDPGVAMAEYPGATGILLDSYRRGIPGGTGEVFDWDRIPKQRPRPLVLAGGLTATNVGDAIRRVRPWAVDVSGGVEREPGVKDPAAMEAFVGAVRAAETGVKV
ncbi:MAG: phosphoribosylanthranilate isomerase [Gammaproteobacteria bacterium]|nr:phosphoribosylanthranilate isomerase [Gammaproteobacteria bacterium]